MQGCRSIPKPGQKQYWAPGNGIVPLIFTTISVVKYGTGGKNNGFCIKFTTGVVVNLEGGGKFINFASKVNLFTN